MAQPGLTVFVETTEVIFYFFVLYALKISRRGAIAAAREGLDDDHAKCNVGGRAETEKYLRNQHLRCSRLLSLPRDIFAECGG
jgi:hypothetical protein